MEITEQPRKKAGRPKKKHPGGRPTVVTPEVVAKLEQAFAYGATDGEASFYAGISPDALYDYCNKNPGFSQRKEALKDKPILKARQTVIDALDNPEHAKWYLARKRKGEFSERNEIGGADGEPIKIDITKTLLGEAVEIT